jgi:hypothetical protein
LGRSGLSLDNGSAQWSDSAGVTETNNSSRLALLARTPAKAIARVRENFGEWKEHHDLGPLVDRVRPYTVVAPAGLVQVARIVRSTLADKVPGDIVECGTYRGGTSFLMADLLRQGAETDRRVWMFDSFEGLPPPEELDGKAAVDFAVNTDDPLYFDNFRTSVEAVQRTSTELGVDAFTMIVKGWFDETLPATKERIGPIAILRLDCDWHASIMCCLDELYDQVSPGGYVVFDDYWAFDGCALAIYEFLAKRQLSHRLESAKGQVWFRKR